jgi:hypothetical protein
MKCRQEYPCRHFVENVMLAHHKLLPWIVVLVSIKVKISIRRR